MAFRSDVARTITPAVLDQAWLVWSRTADRFDDLALATALFATLPAELDTAETAVERARLHLLEGRPTAALAELARCGCVTVPAAGPETSGELVLLAARAAAGDADALRRLLESAAEHAAGPRMWPFAYLVAAAAGQAGEQGIADTAWVSIVRDCGIITPLSLSHVAAGEVARRDAYDPDAAIETVMTQALLLARFEPAPAEDAGPLLAAAADLRGRGDDAGARLLLRAVVGIAPVNAEIEEALRRVTPERAMRRHTVLTLCAAASALVLAPLGGFGVLIAFGVRQVWRRQVRLPGLSRTDSVVLRSIGSVKFDPVAGDVDSEFHNNRGWYGVIGIIGFVAGMVLGQFVVEDAASLFGVGQMTVAIGMWMLCVVGVPALAVTAAVLARRRYLVERGRRRTAARRRQRLSKAGECRCWSDEAFVGEYAEAYFTSHCEPVGAGPTLTELQRRLGDAAALGQCPVTGLTWLGGRLGRGGTAVALRGTVPRPPEEADPGIGLYM